jgi:glycosyltransferase involved in cell wall biosynthesis
MGDSPRFDVSVILPFGDDEEAVGIAVRRTAEHLRQLGLAFEILAIDEDSGDNSHAVLALLRADVPELRVAHAPGRGRGVDVGAARAQGTLLVVSTPDVASASLDGIGDACRRLFAGEGDAEVAIARFTVAHRVRALVAFRGARLVGAAMHRRLAKRLQVRNLAVRVAGTAGTGGSAQPKTAVGRLRAFAARAGRVA